MRVHNQDSSVPKGQWSRGYTNCELSWPPVVGPNTLSFAMCSVSKHPYQDTVGHQGSRGCCRFAMRQVGGPEAKPVGPVQQTSSACQSPMVGQTAPALGLLWCGGQARLNLLRRARVLAATACLAGGLKLARATARPLEESNLVLTFVTYHVSLLNPCPFSGL